MPVIKCANGKYRIGSGACIYDTKAKADSAWKAILAQGKYESNGNQKGKNQPGQTKSGKSANNQG